jgi:hypothetical protein
MYTKFCAFGTFKKSFNASQRYLQKHGFQKCLYKILDNIESIPEILLQIDLIAIFAHVHSNFQQETK